MPGTRWSEAEKEELVRQVREEGRELEEVEIGERPLHGIRRQAVRMELVPIQSNRKRWPKKQVARLRELKEKGFTAAQIHAYDLLGEPRRSLWSVRKMWGRLRLADPSRSESMRTKKVWRKAEKAQFDRFLRENSAQMTPEQIGKLFGVARSTVARRQTQLGVKRSRDAVLKMDYSQAKQQRARNRARERNLRLWEERRAQRLRALEQLDKKLGPRHPRRKCSDCQREWPKRSEFFHTREKTISIGTSRYYKHRCVLCENHRRRELERQRRTSTPEQTEQPGGSAPATPDRQQSSGKPTARKSAKRKPARAARHRKPHTNGRAK